MLDCIAEQEMAITMAVLAESKKVGDRDMILTSSELAVIRVCAWCSKTIGSGNRDARCTEMPTLSVVQPQLTALRKKHLKVSDVEPKVALDMKCAMYN